MNNTIPVNGGAMSNRQAIMTRAWAIFRETYHYPQIKFARIGRPCFAWALKQAWAEAREAARLTTMAPVNVTARIAELNAEIGLAPLNENWTKASRQLPACNARI